MKKVKALYKKITQSVLALIGIGTLTACYGSPPPAGFIEGSVHFIHDDGTPIPVKNIDVTFTTGEASYYGITANDGSFFIQSYHYAQVPIELTFSDTDGDANGGDFKTEVLHPDSASVYDTTYNITLEKK